MAKTLTVFLAADVSKMNRGLKDAESGLNGLGGTLKNMLGPALIAAGVAATAFAVKLGVDGVKSAMADQVALERLSQTLQNVGLAHEIQPVEDYIRSLERSLGVADTELRPAYDRLIRSIGDVEQANKALSLALDISAGTGKSLDAVVQALGRAYDGNTQGLSRLGAGLDSALLKTGDMEAITAKLAQTFGGQATRQAQTFEGQTKRLQTAVDNLGEAFGTGLLNALGDTNSTTENLVQTMGSFEPVLEEIGRTAGGFAVGAGLLARALLQVDDATQKLTESTRKTSDEMLRGATTSQRFGFGIDALIFKIRLISQQLTEVDAKQNALNTTNNLAAQRYQALADSLNGAATAQNNFNAATGAGTVEIEKHKNQVLIDSEAKRDAARFTEYWGSRIEYVNTELDKTSKPGGGSAPRATKATQELTNAQKKAIEAYDKKRETIGGLLDVLGKQTEALGDAKQAFDDYSKSIGDAVTAGIDLGAAFQAQFGKDGELTGVSFLEALTKQITDARAFGEVLTGLRASGAEQNLIDQIASLGPDVGSKLGQQLIEDGLVPTVQGKVDEVAQIAADTGFAMSSEFKQAGIDAATNLIDNTVKEIRKERKKLTALGEGMGKLIGGGIKKEIAQAVAEAVRAAEAAKAAARAEAVARAEAQAQAITDQQVGQALSRLISNSDARTARNVTPVLT